MLPRGRCGDPEAAVQEKAIAATLDAGETPCLVLRPLRSVARCMHALEGCAESGGNMV